MMDDFIFRGVNIASMGAEASLGDAMTVGSKVTRSEHELPGGGSLEAGEPRYGPVTRSITITPRAGANGDEAWMRRIVGWLMGGRGQLIFLKDPDVYRIAQFDKPPSYGWRGWPNGEIEARMTLQPLAHAVRLTSREAATSGGAATIAPIFATGMDVPLGLVIEPTSGTITAATIRCGGRELRLGGMRLTPGQHLTYYAGDTHGGRAELAIDAALAFGAVASWQRLTAGSGSEISVQLTGGEAKLTVNLRGRWIA